jgi:YidC/Oxa1 family membrane protein insertase
MDFSLLTYYLMLPMLEYFKTAFGSYGWAIISLTLVIKFVLLPLSIKQNQLSQKMQSQMAKMKPELDKIQEKYNLRKKKYESDPEKLDEIQKEFQTQMAELYRQNGSLNPLAGCLPTLLQFPLLIALYWAFSGPPFQPSILHANMQATDKVITKNASSMKTVSSSEVNFVDPEGKLSRLKLTSDIPDKLVVGQEYNLEIKQVTGHGKIPPQSASWKILSKDENPHTSGASKPKKAGEKPWYEGVIDMQPSEDNPLALKIKALKPTEKFSIQFQVNEDRGHQKFFFIQDLGRLGLWDAQTKQIHYDICILVLFMGITFWLSNKLTVSSTPQMPSLDESQQEMQKQMQNMMPVMFLGMMAFLPIPAGVFVYFIVSNLFQMGQTYFFNKFVPAPSLPALNSTEEKSKITSDV